MNRENEPPEINGNENACVLLLPQPLFLVIRVLLAKSFIFPAITAVYLFIYSNFEAISVFWHATMCPPCVRGCQTLNADAAAATSAFLSSNKTLVRVLGKRDEHSII